MSKFIQVSLVEEQSGSQPFLNVDHIISVMEYEGHTHISLTGDHTIKVTDPVHYVMDMINGTVNRESY